MLKFEAVRAKSIEERTRLRASINVVSRYGGLAVFSQKWCSRLVRRRNIAEGKEGRRKTYWSMDVIFFLRSICRKNLCLYPRAVPKKRPTLRRELQLTTAGAHQTTGSTNGRVANWAPEIAFSLSASFSVVKNWRCRSVAKDSLLVGERGCRCSFDNQEIRCNAIITPFVCWWFVGVKSY